jgi:hypothetical protein
MENLNWRYAMTKPSHRDAADLTALTFTTAVAISLVKKGVLTKQELKEEIQNLVPAGVIGAVMYQDLISAIDRWRVN